MAVVVWCELTLVSMEHWMERLEFPRSRAAASQRAPWLLRGFGLPRATPHVHAPDGLNGQWQVRCWTRSRSGSCWAARICDSGSLEDCMVVPR
jgi:hypothetical protein